MSSINPCPPWSAQRLLAALLGVLTLAGCDSAPRLPDFDLLPPSLFAGPGDAEPAEPAPPVSEAPVPRDQSNEWHAISGPIFDWRAEGRVGPLAVEREPQQPPVTAAAAAPASPSPPKAAPVPVIVSLKPALTLGATAPVTPSSASPPPWQATAGPIFDWAAERSAAVTPEATPQAPSAWQLRERQMRELPGWRLNGRVAINSPQESWSAVLRWEQNGDAFHVRLSNPLGQGLLDLRGVPGEVLLRTAEGQVYRAPDAQTLLRDVAGMNLPVSGLRYWLLAVTDPSAAAADVDLDGDSLPLSVVQAGWRIEYDRYRDTDGVRLPDRLTFTGDDLGGRLIVTQWDLHGS